MAVRINSRVTALRVPANLINTQGEDEGGKSESKERREKIRRALMDRW